MTDKAAAEVREPSRGSHGGTTNRLPRSPSLPRGYYKSAPSFTLVTSRVLQIGSLVYPRGNEGKRGKVHLEISSSDSTENGGIHRIEAGRCACCIRGGSSLCFSGLEATQQELGERRRSQVSPEEELAALLHQHRN
jgi:hypothetical protein